MGGREDPPDLAAIEAREAEATGTAKPIRKLTSEQAKQRAEKAAIIRKANQAAKLTDEAARQRADKAAAKPRAKAVREATVQGELDLMLSDAAGRSPGCRRSRRGGLPATRTGSPPRS